MFKVWLKVEEVEDENDCYEGTVNHLFLGEFQTTEAAEDFASKVGTAAALITAESQRRKQ